MFELSVPSFGTLVLIYLHSSNVERPRDVGHSITIRDELFPSVGGRCMIPLSLRIDSLHELDHG